MVWDLGFGNRVLGMGFRGLGLGVLSPEFRSFGCEDVLRFRVLGFGFRISGFGF